MTGKIYKPLAHLEFLKISTGRRIVIGAGVPPALPVQAGNYLSRDRLCRLEAGRRARTPAPLQITAFGNIFTKSQQERHTSHCALSPRNGQYT
jgi:hypothetical protein